MKVYRQVAVASYRERLGYQAGLLAGMCSTVAAIILIGNIVTKDRIHEMERLDQLSLLEQVIPNHTYDNALLDDKVQIELAGSVRDLGITADQLTVYIAKKGVTIQGYAFNIKAKGYGGNIDLLMGVDSKGHILGVRTVSHKETPGLGDKIDIQKDDWITGFNGYSLANTGHYLWNVKKDGGQFDQFTGATITPRAVVKAVYQGLTLLEDQQPAILKEALSIKTVSEPEKPVSAAEKASAPLPEEIQ